MPLFQAFRKGYEVRILGMRMDWRDVRVRIGEGESERTEFKRGLGDLSAVGKTVCAFANTEGGVVILGVTDAKEIVGIREDVERVQERLTSFLQTGCSAPVTARAGRHEDPYGWVCWLEIPRQRGFEPLRYGGRVWVRRQRSSVEPSPAELQELYNAFGYILTEERTIQAATTAHIDIQAFRAYLQKSGIDIMDEIQPDDEDDLRNRGVVADLGGELHPTLYGTLAFGKKPQSYPQTHNFRVDCVAYEGDDRASDVLQVAEAAGRLDEQVQRAIGWFSSLGRFESYHGLIRKDHPLLPRAALRESLVNAVVHRDYAITGSKVLLEVFARHVDVTSPGGLPNHMSVQSVQAGGHPRSRNESMAHYMLVMGFMEQRGRGWPVMRRAMREFNDTEPAIVQDDARQFVRLRFHLGPARSYRAVLDA